MKLLIHDLTLPEWERIQENYSDCKVVSNTGPIRPCIGCFHCWTSGTGRCVFKDGYDNMCTLIHEADEMIIMSKYTYGGFSSFVKNVFDRCIGYVLPEFEVAYGEMHHKKRFAEDKPVTFVFRGHDLSEDERRNAREYTAALCRNLRGRVKDVVFEECAEETDETVSGETAERSGILLVDCSLRGNRSNTNVFLKKLQELIGPKAQLVSLSTGMTPEETAAAIGKAQTVVLGAPLYVDGLPSSALRVMEEVKKTGAGRGCRLYAAVNNGLYESAQNVNILKMIKAFCEENGIIYRGGAAIGAGEVVGTLMRGAKHSLWPARNAETCLSSLADAIRQERETEDLYADPFVFPRWMYILIANTNWQRLKRAERKVKTKA